VNQITSNYNGSAPFAYNWVNPTCEKSVSVWHAQIRRTQL
jgi:hypothetical protein